MFAQKLKETREAKGITQEKLAETVGISRNSLFGYENGIKVPNVVTAQKLAEALGVSLDELMK